MKQSEMIEKQERRIKNREKRYRPRSFSKLTEKERELVERATKEEGEGLSVDDFNFGFGRVQTDEITRPLFDHNTPNDRNYVDRVKELERSIMSRGFDPDKPVLLMEFGQERLKAVGGNHRSQAVRNMQKRNELPKTYGVPSIIMFLKDDEVIRQELTKKNISFIPKSHVQ